MEKSNAQRIFERWEAIIDALSRELDQRKCVESFEICFKRETEGSEEYGRSVTVRTVTDVGDEKLIDTYTAFESGEVFKLRTERK